MCLNKVHWTDSEKPDTKLRTGYKIFRLNKRGKVSFACQERKLELREWMNSNSKGKSISHRNPFGVPYEPGFHILTSKKAAMKLTRAKNNGLYPGVPEYVCYEVEYTDTVAKGNETEQNICWTLKNKRTTGCHIARRMRVLRKIKIDEPKEALRLS